MNPLMALSCPAYLLIQPAPGTESTHPTCLQVDFDVAGRLETNLPDDGISTLATLPRSRTELALTDQTYGARVAFEGIRSGGVSSPVGIDGESIVARLQIAEAWMRFANLGLRIGAGIVDDPFIITANDAWLIRAVAPTLTEENGWLERSDLGAIVSYTAPGEIASAVVSITSGEGARFVERNNGKNTTGMLIVRPFAVSDQAERLTVSLYGRDGSRGLGSARDHRLGGRLTTDIGPAHIGAEAMWNYGLTGDPDQTPWGWSLWGRAGLPLNLAAFARADQTTAISEEPTSRTTTLRGGVGWQPAPLAMFILGAEQRSLGEQAAVTAGADGASQSTTLYVLLNVRHRGAVALTPLEM